MTGGSSSGGFEGDAVSESFELGDEASGGSFGVAAAEVVAAGFAVELAGLQHVPARAEDRVFDGAERPSVAAAGAQALGPRGEGRRAGRAPRPPPPRASRAAPPRAPAGAFPG